MQKKYSHIFFDLDNTLWDFEKNSFFAMEITFQKFIKSNTVHFNDFFSVYTKHNNLLWEDYRNQRVTKKELIQKRFKLTFDEFGIHYVDPEQMNHFYLSEMPKQKNLNEGVPEMLEYLKHKKYNLGIITNGFREVQLKKIDTAGISGYFSKVFISESIKTPKPGKEIFEYAVKSSNAKKSKCIMIGDDWDVDILGASNFGIDSIYYNQPGTDSKFFGNINRNERNIIHVIQSFKEVKDIL